MIKNNQDLTMLVWEPWNCQGEQRSGILTHPPFFAPCGCYDDLLIPFGTITGLLRSLLKKGLKGASEKFLVKILLKNRLGKLAAKKIAANQAYDNVESIFNEINQKLFRLQSDLEQEILERSKKYRRLQEIGYKVDTATPERVIKSLEKTILEIKTFYSDWRNEILRLQQQFPGETYFPGWDLSLLEYRRLYGVDKPAYHIARSEALGYKKNSYIELIRKFNSANDDLEKAKTDLIQWRKRLQDAIDLQTKYSEEIETLYDAIDGHIRKENIINESINAVRPSHVLGPGRVMPEGNYRRQLDYLEDQSRELIDELKEIEALENRANNSSVLEKVNQDIDTAFPDIGATMADVIVDILSAASIVGPHLCREGEDGVTLNEENCKCDICPPDKQLCQPINFDPGLRLPWTAIADSSNYCLDPCCENKVDSEGRPLRIYKPATVFYGGILELLSVPPCSCECPQDALGDPRIQRPCVTSQCNDGYTCASEKFPDDDCTTLRVFSKFYWYDGSDPANPDCGFRCKEELSDADCFATYGQFTKWDTTNAYCNCICKEKSETDCPPRATYTRIDSYNNNSPTSQCDEINNPTEPVCTCVCDRPDDCPPGFKLNRSPTTEQNGTIVFGNTFCECIPDSFTTTTTTPGPCDDNTEYTVSNVSNNSTLYDTQQEALDRLNEINDFFDSKQTIFEEYGWTYSSRVMASVLQGDGKYYLDSVNYLNMKCCSGQFDFNDTIPNANGFSRCIASNGSGDPEPSGGVSGGGSGFSLQNKKDYYFDERSSSWVAIIKN